MHFGGLVAVAMAVVAFAGCTEGSAPEEGNAPATSQSIMAPTWALGDYWSFQDDAGQTFTLVVAGEQGSDWLLLTDHKDVAYFDRVADISYIGPITKDLLAGRQGEDEVRYFDFPLTDGKTWHTAWDGSHRLIEARQTGEGRFELTAYSGTEAEGPIHVEYTYDAATRFFGSMTFYNATTGETSYTLSSTGHGSRYQGDVYVYGAIRQMAEVRTGAGASQAMFDVSDDQGELAIQVELDCAGGTGVLLLALDGPEAGGGQDPVPPAPFVNEPAYGHTVDCPAGGYSGLDTLPATPGTWRLDALAAASGGSASATVTHRSLEVLSIGAT